jgi:nitroreductase
MLGNLKSFAPATHDLENNMSVSRTLRSRVSVRAYTSEALSIETVNEILDAARWSPSGGKMQPWKVIAVAGRATQRLSRATSTSRTMLSEGPVSSCPRGSGSSAAEGLAVVLPIARKANHD